MGMVFSCFASRASCAFLVKPTPPRSSSHDFCRTLSSYYACADWVSENNIAILFPVAATAKGTEKWVLLDAHYIISF